MIIFLLTSFWTRDCNYLKSNQISFKRIMLCSVIFKYKKATFLHEFIFEFNSVFHWGNLIKQ